MAPSVEGEETRRTGAHGPSRKGRRVERGASSYRRAMNDRQAIARLAAAALRGGELPACFVGFDGFVDSITRLVATRRSSRADDFEALRTIPEFAARCAAAAGRSTNIERVTLEDRFGGNGPLMANALMALGAPVSFVGAIGVEGDPGAIDPVFAPFAARCARCVPIARPGHTLCLEFDDGKVMMNDTSRVQDVTWPRIVERVGIDRLRAFVGGASVIGVVNWSLLGGVEGIWDGLRTQVLGPAGDGRERRVFIDLSDPAKRVDDDIRRAMRVLRELEDTPGVSVTLGLNLAEAERLAAVFSVRSDALSPASRRLPALASDLRAALGFDAVIVHPREGAAGAWRGEVAWFDGPFTRAPVLSTGAGDHFNAGVAAGQAMGLGLAACLALGCATSGAYVRDGESPSRDRVAGLLDNLPPPDDRPRGESGGA
ncbi:MAG: PfkB family carbohydrate kinase [Planctomycetota bacterium]|nr:PfkB family carbohydrate kinase [Planctomycetota bacterium]